MSNTRTEGRGLGGLTLSIGGVDGSGRDANWGGFDYLYALVNGRKVPHYGNDDDYADRNPDKYPGLLVYVAGYSTLWKDLGDKLKQDIISRTELAFDDNSDLTPPD